MFVSERLKNENMTSVLYTLYKGNAFLSLIILWELLRKSIRGLGQQKIHCCFHGSKIMVDKWSATFIFLVCSISHRPWLLQLYPQLYACRLLCHVMYQKTYNRQAVTGHQGQRMLWALSLLVSPLSGTTPGVSRTSTLENLFWSNLNICTALDAPRLCSVVKF